MKLTLIAGAVVVVVVGVIWLGNDSERLVAPSESGHDVAPAATEGRADSRAVTASAKSAETFAQSESSLPISLLGVTYSQDPAQSLALIRYAQDADTYRTGQYIADSGIFIETIEPDKIIVRMDEQLFEVRLSRDMTEAASDDMSAQSGAADSELQPDTDPDVGNRPQALSHIVTLSDRYSGDAVSVSPGVNPALFKSAGFKEGDELLSVNGKDVSLDGMLDTINREIRSAHTLKFEVLRNGRPVTLYLDIPTEALKLR